MNFLSNILREEGGFEYKKDIVDSILILIRDIPEAKESGLSHLCEFIEDCEFTYLSTQVGLTIAAWIYELDAEAPFKTLDILDMHAVAKHSAPVCANARDLIETSKLQLAEGRLNEAYEFSEAFAILQ